MIPRQASCTLLAAGIISATSALAFAQLPADNAVENTLMKLRQMHSRNDTAALSADQRRAIADHVQACWHKDSGAAEADRLSVSLIVTTDVAGVVQKAEVAGSDIRRVDGDARLHAFAERVIQALMDPKCANLPLPPTALGKVNILTFRFAP